MSYSLSLLIFYYLTLMCRHLTLLYWGLWQRNIFNSTPRALAARWERHYLMNWESLNPTTTLRRPTTPPSSPFNTSHCHPTLHLCGARSPTDSFPRADQVTLSPQLHHDNKTMMPCFFVVVVVVVFGCFVVSIRIPQAVALLWLKQAFHPQDQFFPNMFYSFFEICFFSPEWPNTEDNFVYKKNNNTFSNYFIPSSRIFRLHWNKTQKCDLGLGCRLKADITQISPGKYTHLLVQSRSSQSQMLRPR